MESAFIHWLREHCPVDERLKLPIGDDAAVLGWSRDQDLVLAADLLADGVHFRLAEHDPRRIGHKALGANLSDLAAMAATPIAAFVSICLPRKQAGWLAREIYQGMFPLAAEFSISIAGGDTNVWDGPLVINVTVIGRAPAAGVWRRDGAEPGDVILVTGELGGSLAGRHLDCRPRVAEALALAENYSVHAAIDISDGLLLDLSRVCEASSCGAEIRLDALPISPDAERLSAADPDDETPLDRALSDGEDFELLLVMPPEAAERLIAEPPFATPVSIVGRMTTEAGLRGIDSRGDTHLLTPAGFWHDE